MSPLIPALILALGAGTASALAGADAYLALRGQCSVAQPAMLMLLAACLGFLSWAVWPR